jgi:hypothetical protein
VDVSLLRHEHCLPVHPKAVCGGHSPFRSGMHCGLSLIAICLERFLAGIPRHYREAKAWRTIQFSPSRMTLPSFRPYRQDFSTASVAGFHFPWKHTILMTAQMFAL